LVTSTISCSALFRSVVTLEDAGDRAAWPLGTSESSARFLETAGAAFDSAPLVPGVSCDRELLLQRPGSRRSRLGL
jgi:hypothetical protein